MSNKLKIDLRLDPKPHGFKIWDKGFLYELADSKPHTDRNNNPTLVTYWTCECAEGGHKFTHVTGAAIYNLPRRCTEHAKGKGWGAVAPHTYHAASEADLNATEEGSRSERQSLVYEIENMKRLLGLALAGGGRLTIEQAREIVWAEQRDALEGSSKEALSALEDLVIAHKDLVYERGRQAVKAERKTLAALKPSPEDLLS
jgi:hypothetical protein